MNSFVAAIHVAIFVCCYPYNILNFLLYLLTPCIQLTSLKCLSTYVRTYLRVCILIYALNVKWCESFS